MSDIAFHEVTNAIGRCCEATGKTYDEVKEEVVGYTGIHIKKFKEYPRGIVVNPTDNREILSPKTNFYFEPEMCDQLFILWDDSIKVEVYI